MSGPRLRRPCDVSWFPHALTKARPYPAGWRCNAHAPWAIAGQDEPKPTDSVPASALPLSPLSASHVADERAIASGKRRSNPAAYKAAQAAVNHRKDTRP